MMLKKSKVKKIIERLELYSDSTRFEMFIRNVHEQLELDSVVNKLEFELKNLINKIFELKNLINKINEFGSTR